MSIEAIVVALVTALVTAGIQELRSRAVRKTIQEKLDQANGNALLANANAGEALDLLKPAVAQLPKTRARKAKPAGEPKAPRAKKGATGGSFTAAAAGEG